MGEGSGAEGKDKGEKREMVTRTGAGGAETRYTLVRSLGCSLTATDGFEMPTSECAPTKGQGKREYHKSMPTTTQDKRPNSITGTAGLLSHRVALPLPLPFCRGRPWCRHIWRWHIRSCLRDGIHVEKKRAEWKKKRDPARYIVQKQYCVYTLARAKRARQSTPYRHHEGPLTKPSKRGEGLILIFASLSRFGSCPSPLSRGKGSLPGGALARQPGGLRTVTS